jgi:hypothetical protein
MRSVAVSSLISTFVLVACQGRAEKVNRLLDQYNAEYPGYARTCLEEDTSGAARLLTGQTLTAEQRPSKPRRRNATPGASQRLTVWRNSREKSLPHSSNAVLLLSA